MGLSGIGNYNTSSIAGDRKLSNSSPADIIAALNTKAKDDSSTDQSTRYDFKSMTPSQMKPIAKQLFDDGKIDITQLLMLQQAGVPLGKLGPNGEFVELSAAERTHYENTPVNYQQVGTDAMNYIKSTGQQNDPKSGYAFWKSIVDVLNVQQGTLASVDFSA